MSAAALETQAAPPEHAILWVIDGISFKAPERIQLKNLQALMASGVYYRQNYTVQTADPSHVPGAVEPVSHLIDPQPGPAGRHPIAAAWRAALRAGIVFPSQDHRALRQ